MAKKETSATEEQDRRRRRGSSVPSGNTASMKVPGLKKKPGKRMPSVKQDKPMPMSRPKLGMKMPNYD